MRSSILLSLSAVACSASLSSVPTSQPAEPAVGSSSPSSPSTLSSTAPAPPVASSVPSPAPPAVPETAPTAIASAAPTVDPPSKVITTLPEPPPADDAVPPASAAQKAFVTGPLLGTDVVFITVAPASETCASVVGRGSPAKGDTRASVKVQWTPGYYDFSNHMAETKLATYQGTFWLKEDATRGGVRVRAAPLKQGTTGRIHVTGTRPGSAQTLDAELEAVVCVDLVLKHGP